MKKRRREIISLPGEVLKPGTEYMKRKVMGGRLWALYVNSDGVYAVEVVYPGLLNRGGRVVRSSITGSLRSTQYGDVLRAANLEDLVEALQ